MVGAERHPRSVRIPSSCCEQNADRHQQGHWVGAEVEGALPVHAPGLVTREAVCGWAAPASVLGTGKGGLFPGSGTSWRPGSTRALNAELSPCTSSWRRAPTERDPVGGLGEPKALRVHRGDGVPDPALGARSVPVTGRPPLSVTSCCHCKRLGCGLSLCGLSGECRPAPEAADAGQHRPINTRPRGAPLPRRAQLRGDVLPGAPVARRGV